MNIEKMEKNLNVPGAKDDGEKTLAGLLLDFSRALEEVAEVGTFGARKYTRGGWQSVENAEQRYTDAFMRHVLKLQTEKVDPETGFMHWAHAAWNALAVLELYLREEELDLMELVSGRMNEEREGMQLTTGGETFEEVEQGDLRDTTSSTTEQQIEDFFEFLSTVLDLPKGESEAYPAFELNEEETKIIEGLRTVGWRSTRMGKCGPTPASPPPTWTIG